MCYIHTARAKKASKTTIKTKNNNKFQITYDTTRNYYTYARDDKSKKMEVRSTTEKCAKTDSTMNCKNNDVKLNPTAEPFGSNATSTVTETSTIQSKTTANENKCEIMDSAMSRDERESYFLNINFKTKQFNNFRTFNPISTAKNKNNTKENITKNAFPHSIALCK